MFERDLVRHEDDTVRMLSGVIVYRLHRLSKLLIDWGLHNSVYEKKKKQDFKVNIKEWRRQFGRWSTQSKSLAITEFILPGVKGLVELVDFEKYEKLTEIQRRQLLSAIFEKDGLLIAIQMYQRIRKHIDFGGIWSGPDDGDRMELKRRRWQKLVFIETYEACWTMRLNAKPTLDKQLRFAPLKWWGLVYKLSEALNLQLGDLADQPCPKNADTNQYGEL